LLANVGFGGKLLYGGLDAQGAPLPADPNCNHNVRSSSVDQALGPDHAVHGSPSVNLLPGSHPLVQNPCGDVLREQVIHAIQSGNAGALDPGPDASGYPTFTDWPAWNDLTHQKMWVDWVRRAWQGGLRVMVALAVNTKLLADLTSGPRDGPDDDMASGDVQIREIQRFVANHADFMAIASNSDELNRIVAANKLAVVIGVELDNIGDLVGAVPPGPVLAEIDRLYGEGVRYIFPVHLVDNPIGGSAAYNDSFNSLDVYEENAPRGFELICSRPADGINYVYAGDTNMQQFGAALSQPRKFLVDPSGAVKGLADSAAAVGGDVVQWSLEQVKLGRTIQAPPPIRCPPGLGNVNARGLTATGVAAIKRMMQLGMLIDIDHMDQLTALQTLQLAGARPGGATAAPNYPLNSGHNGLRGFFTTDSLDATKPAVNSERSLTPAMYQMIGSMHGMAGVGSAKLNALQWSVLYNAVVRAMQTGMSTPLPGAGGFGTDLNGLEFGMPPPFHGQWQNNPKYQACYATAVRNNCPSGDLTPNQLAACRNKADAGCLAQFPRTMFVCGDCNPALEVSYCPVNGPAPAGCIPASVLGTRWWNYNFEGVAHYGLLWDFVVGVSKLPGGASLVNDNLMSSAEYFYQTWKKAEQQSRFVQ
jgi:hypothetical protein